MNVNFWKSGSSNLHNIQTETVGAHAMSAAQTHYAAQPLAHTPLTTSNSSAPVSATTNAVHVTNSGAATAGKGGAPAPVSSGHFTPGTMSHETIAAMKSGALAHLDMQLASIYQQQHLDPGAASGVHPTGQPSVTTSALSGGFVTVDITASDANQDGSTRDDAALLLTQLQDMGMGHASSFAGMVSGTIAVDQVSAVADFLSSGNLGFARVSEMMSSAGSVESQDDIAQHGPQARADYGVDGTGLRLGVLSDSFDTNAGATDSSGNPDHMAEDIASGDLPSDTVLVDDYDSAGSDEGRGMAQLAHDIAPGAAIDFATAFEGGQAGFANNILALRDAGDSVICDDVAYYAELAYQQGPIAQAVNQVAADGVSYFSSAGNNGNEGVEIAWNSNPLYSYFGEELLIFGNGKDYIPITLAEFQVVVLQWDEPGASAGGAGSASDLDLFLTNQDGSVFYFGSFGANEGGDPVELMGISASGGEVYYLRVGLYSGPAPTEVRLMALGNGAPVDLGKVKHNINDGTLYGHAAAENGNAVGAVRYDATPDWGVNPPDSEYYTSSGFDRIWFDDDGVRLGSPDERNVAFSAGDGGDTTFFGFDYDGNGFNNFFGTSAAAPNAAAVAVLMMEANVDLNPTDIRNLLGDASLDMDANNGSPPGAANPGAFDNGPDDETGAGFIQGDLAVAFASTLHIQNNDAVVLNGTHLNDEIVGNGNANVINGGDGDDIITGGIRGDTLTGGNGYDTFVYNSVLDSIVSVRFDTITDLEDLYDTIDLSAIDANEGVAGDQAFHFSGMHHITVGSLLVKYHPHGGFHGQTTITGFTNGDSTPDLFIVVDGNHESFANWDL